MRAAFRRGHTGELLIDVESSDITTPSSSPALGPTVEAIAEGRVTAVFTRAVAPSRTRLQHVNNPADDAPVVVLIRPRQSCRQMRLDTSPLPIIQPSQPAPISLAPIKNSQERESRDGIFVDTGA